MHFSFSLHKSLSSLLVLAIVTVCNIHAASSFTEIDISKTPGNGDAIKAAAVKACGSNLSVDELTRRVGLADTADLNFFNPRILESLKVDNVALNKALNCQKNRNAVLKNTCQLQASTKQNLKCETDMYTQKVESNVKSVDDTCTGVDFKLFIDVTGISEPNPSSATPKPCVVETNEVFTTKFVNVDITKIPGAGDAAKTESERVCSADLSEGELQHRSKLGESIELAFFVPKITDVAGNEPLIKALTCQKLKNNIMARTCLIEAARKQNDAFQVDENSIKLDKSISAANTFCANVDPKLFVDVKGTGINLPSATGRNALRNGAINTKRPVLRVVGMAFFLCLLA